MSARAASHAAAWSALVALLVGLALPFHAHTDIGAHTSPGYEALAGISDEAPAGHAPSPATHKSAGHTPSSTGHAPDSAPASPGGDDAHGGDCTLCEALRQVSHYFASAPVEPGRFHVSVFALRAAQAQAPATALLRGPRGRAPPRSAFAL